MNFVKNFPKNRVCVIDVYPAFKHSLKKAIEFTSNNNITLNSPDGGKILIGYCLKAIEATFKNVQSQYPKVLCICIETNNPGIKHFITNHLEKFIKNLPYPYCGQQDFNSPDLETAAAAHIDTIKKQENYQKMKERLNLRGV
jgi:hypothetical protein